MFTVYVIQNTDNKIYIGQTANLQNRLKRHNNQLVSRKKSFTYKNKGTWTVVYKEEFSTRLEAINRERQLKSYQGRKYIREKILNLGP